MKQQSSNDVKNGGRTEGEPVSPPAENHVKPLAVRILLIEKMRCASEAGMFAVPKRWVVVASWMWDKLIFYTITFYSNENSKINYAIRTDLFLLNQAKHDVNLANQLITYMGKDIFYYALNNDLVDRLTHIVHIDEQGDWYVSQHAFELFLQQVKNLFPNAEELTTNPDVSRMLKHFQTIPQRSKVLITHYVDKYPQFVCGCEYFANELFELRFNGCKTTGVFAVWDDTGNIHYLGQGSCKLSQNEELSLVQDGIPLP